MLGFRELLIILVLLLVFGVPVLIGLFLLFRSRRSSSPESRLAKLEQMRSSGSLTQAEYDRQRASIISGV